MKKELRKKYIKLRDCMTYNDIIQKSQIIENKILQSEYMERYNVFLVYFNIKSEVKTYSLIEKLISLNKKVYIPKIINSEMIFLRINSLADLVPGKYNIPEPKIGKKYNSEKALVIVPGVVFSKKKYRIGYGKGYYDKFISKNRQNFYLGICFENQIIDKFDFDEFDEQLDRVITEENIIK